MVLRYYSVYFFLCQLKSYLHCGCSVQMFSLVLILSGKFYREILSAMFNESGILILPFRAFYYNQILCDVFMFQAQILCDVLMFQIRILSDVFNHQRMVSVGFYVKTFWKCFVLAWYTHTLSLEARRVHRLLFPSNTLPNCLINGIHQCQSTRRISSQQNVLYRDASTAFSCQSRA